MNFFQSLVVSITVTVIVTVTVHSVGNILKLLERETDVQVDMHVDWELCRKIVAYVGRMKVILIHSYVGLVNKLVGTLRRQSTGWKGLEGAGRGWKILEGAGKGWKGLEEDGRGWKRLEGAGGGWKRLEEAERDWEGLEEAGRG